MFGWCASGHHNECIREVEKFYFEPKSKRNPTGLVMTGEMLYCQCDKRGCSCFVKAADRAKPRRKKK